MNQKSIKLESNKSSNKVKKNKVVYISTYNFGKIGINKIIAKDNVQLSLQANLNNNLNYTNTNTNSNTNHNSSKNREAHKTNKKFKNYYYNSPSSTQTKWPKDNNYFNYKVNKRINISSKNNIKKSFSQMKLTKKKFSKSVNNLHIYNSNTNNNCYIGNTNLNSNNNNKINKERKITEVSSHKKSNSFNSNFIFSSMGQTQKIKKKKNFSISDLILKEMKIKKLRGSSNMSNASNNIINQTKNQKQTDKINFEKKYQMTEGNIYLRVRKKDEIIKNNIYPNQIEERKILSKNNSKSKYTSQIFNNIIRQNNMKNLGTNFVVNNLLKKELNISNESDCLIKNSYSKKKKGEIGGLKIIKTEGNVLNNKTRNQTNFDSLNSKKKVDSINSLSNKKSKNNYNKNTFDKRVRQHRYKSIYFKKNDKIHEILNSDKQKERTFNFNCPEELHFFMVKVSLNYKSLNHDF